MKRLGSHLFYSLFIALLIILAKGNSTHAATIYGTLSNFDVINDTGDDCHGFEIELEDISSSDIVYTFGAPYERYGNPTLVPTPTGVIVRYASAYSAITGWAATTPLAPSPTPVTLGHQCWTYGDSNYINSGCEHFGVSLIKNATKTTYRWLVANPNAPGTLTPLGASVSIPAPVWNVVPQPAAPPVVEAVIPAPPPEPIAPISQWGKPIWVKVFKTESPIQANLDNLVLDNPGVPDGNDPIEIEVEWKLLQSPPQGVAGNGREAEVKREQAGDGNKSVTRRYEFYKYLGPVNPEDNEAKCDNPLNCPNSVGDFIGAQNAAVNLIPVNRLEVNKAGNGTGVITSDIPGINCGNICLNTFDAGSVVTLTATPDAGTTFTGWGGDADCTDSVVTIDAAKTCIATFVKPLFEENDPAITYTGTWSNYVCASCNGGGIKISNNTGAKASFTFSGTGIKWIVAKGNMMGKARVYLDGVNMGLVDLYSATLKYKVVLPKTDLAPGNHIITLEVSGQKNPGSTGYYIDIDSFDVVP